MPDPLDPATTALLVMDYQDGIVSSLTDTDALLGRVEAAISVARVRGALVGWVRVGFEDADIDAVPAHSAMAGVVTPERRAALHAAAPTTQIHRRFQPQPHDVSVRKTRIGAFSTTDLDAQLRARGVSSIVLAGICTSGVVLSTVRDAMDRDYRVVVLRDACADRDPATHDFLVDRIFPAHAAVAGVDDLDALLPA